MNPALVFCMSALVSEMRGDYNFEKRCSRWVADGSMESMTEKAWSTTSPGLWMCYPSLSLSVAAQKKVV